LGQKHGLVRERLQGWERYIRPGLDFLVGDPELAVDFEEVRERATRAHELARKLFGEGPLEMLSKPFPEQSQLMANLLRLIDEDQHSPAMLELCGDELLPILQRCQVEYAAMVDRRSGAESGSRVDLRSVRAKLGRRIVNYSTLMLTLIDEDAPASINKVETALLPMVLLRTRRTRGASDTNEDTAALPSDDAELLDQLNNATLPEQDG